MLSEFHKLPNRKMYWETLPDTLLQAVSDSMSRDSFEHIFRNLHLCEKEQLQK